MSTSPPSSIAPAGTPGTTPDTRRIPWMLISLLIVAIVLVAALSYWFFVGRFVESTDDAYVGGDVTVLAPRVSGFVTDVLVKDNQYVHANQVLIRLDARDYDAVLAHANAELLAASAVVKELQAKRALQDAVIKQQTADVTASRAEFVRSAADEKRYSE